MIIAVTLILVLGMMVGVNVVLNAKLASNESAVADDTAYEYHVAMISSAPSDVFWKSIYEEAKNKGKDLGIYVENFGADLSENYSTEEMLEMAIAAKVDGIIVEAGKDREITELIDKAATEGDGQGNEIPVITMLNDAIGSKRKSFVSANDYALGEQYGSEVMDAAEKIYASGADKTAKVAVLIGSDEEDSSSNLIYAGISEAVAKSSKDVELSTVSVNRSGNFESEEAIRNLFLNVQERPDVIVCLSVTDTVSAYQCVIDYNLVGKIQIIGYYYEAGVLEGIRKGLIKSTVAVNAQEMGSVCIEGMYEYLTEEYISEYLPVASELITQDNVQQYMKKDDK